MFGKSKRKQPTVNTLVGADARVLGDIEFSGGCLIDGRVKGNIRAVGQEKSMLSVSERGSVEGTVRAPHILLNGTVQGDVYATARIELGPKSRVIGNVQYKLIEMSIGAEVNGKLIHETGQVPERGSHSSQAGQSGGQSSQNSQVSQEGAQPAAPAKAVGE